MYFKVTYSGKKVECVWTFLVDMGICSIEPDLFLPWISLVLVAVVAHKMVIGSHTVVLLGFLDYSRENTVPAWLIVYLCLDKAQSVLLERFLSFFNKTNCLKVSAKAYM